ncbi:uncharacterized protein LOC143628661 [Bidens hawaiensis]|uniref:uncharacterized protein LOC143628661 n=1 Tax=Bidens hawaiensis TaxID=980011 RepID=UPI0040497BEE
MSDLVSCYNQYAVQVSESSSCSSYTCVTSPNLIPSIQTAVTSLYKTALSTGDIHLIAVTWYRTATAQGLHISSGNHPAPAFRLSTHSGLFWKKKGGKSFKINGSKFEIYYDLSSAPYGPGVKLVEGYYILITVDSELGLVVGDMTDEPTIMKLKTRKRIGKFSLISCKEYFSSNMVYSTKARFEDTGSWHDIMIRCTRENDRLRYPALLVCIDKRVVVRVKRLQWNFRGNQPIFLDGLLVDLMWDVHDWFFNPYSGSGSESGSGHGVFIFRTRSGLNSSLWLEEKCDDQKKRILIVNLCHQKLTTRDGCGLTWKRD